MVNYRTVHDWTYPPRDPFADGGYYMSGKAVIIKIPEISHHPGFIWMMKGIPLSCRYTMYHSDMPHTNHHSRTDKDRNFISRPDARSQFHQTVTGVPANAAGPYPYQSTDTIYQKILLTLFLS